MSDSISREETYKILCEAYPLLQKDYLRRVIDEVPTAEVKGDLISRADAIARATQDHDFYKGATAKTDKARRDELLNVICWLGELPSAEHTVAHIQDFTKYQIAWLTEHDDLELEPELESWVIRFLEDTASCYDKEYLTSAERKGKWIKHEGSPFYVIECSECGAKWLMSGSWDANNFCGNCGARMEDEA